MTAVALDRAITPAEAARISGRHLTVLYKLAARKQLELIQIGGRDFFRQDQIAALESEKAGA